MLREISDRRDVETRLQAIRDGGVPSLFRRTAIRHWRRQLAGGAALGASNAPVRGRNKRGFGCRRRVARCLSNCSPAAGRNQTFNQVVDAAMRYN